MLKKIVSGGQTGADRAALDAAIQFAIPHGGWVPLGRKTEDGRVPDTYHMQETTSISYAERTEMNVVDSDGTLILSHGELKDGSALTQRVAHKHRKPCLHVDLAEMDQSTAVEVVTSWIDARGIQTLNVAGPRASKDPRICDDTKALLKEIIVRGLPKTVEEAVERLLSKMPLRDKTRISAMSGDDLHLLNPTLGAHIRQRFGLNSGNEALMEACCKAVGNSKLHVDEASGVIIRQLWGRLKETHTLRAVK